MRTAITALALFSLPMAALAQSAGEQATGEQAAGEQAAAEQGPQPPTGPIVNAYSPALAEVLRERDPTEADVSSVLVLVDAAVDAPEQPAEAQAPPPAMPGIDTLLSGVFGIIDGAPYRRLERVSAALIDLASARDGETFAGFSPIGGAVATAAGEGTGEGAGEPVQRYRCEAGGELGLSVRDRYTTALTLSACGVGGAVANGSIVVDTGAGLLMNLAPLEIIGADGTRARWQGTRDFYSALTVLSAGLERSASIAEVADAEGNITVLEQSTVDFAVSGRNGGSVRHRLSASLSVRAPWTGQQVVRVATADEFTDLSADGYYQTGVLDIALPDGTTITLDAATGDPDTYSAATRSLDGSVERQQLRSWTDTERLPCLSAERSDAGCDLVADGAFGADRG